MSDTFIDKLITSLRSASKYDSGSMQPPEVILWPDPQSQWQSIIHKLMDMMPELLMFGAYDPEHKTGPAIWLKAMVARTLPEANWDEKLTPVIYLPGYGKNDLKNLAKAKPEIAPLMEYQFTGNLWTHRNGKEWTVVAFMQNKDDGLGLDVSSDNATRDAALKALQNLAESNPADYPSHVNSDYLYELLFPDHARSILEWMCKGAAFLQQFENEKQQVFVNICNRKYHFHPDQKNIRSIAEKLGSRRENWERVWRAYALAPQKFPEIADLLRVSKPDEIDDGLFKVPPDSWPQINEEQETELRKELELFATYTPKEIAGKLLEIEIEHEHRSKWVWSELGKAPLAGRLQHLKILHGICSQKYDFKNLDDIIGFYTATGYKADHAVLKIFEGQLSGSDANALKIAVNAIYKPWLETINQRFQKFAAVELKRFNREAFDKEEADFVLFVDAFRYDIARAFIQQLPESNFKVACSAALTALPSVTPTSKPAVSPVADEVDQKSGRNEGFCPALKTGKTVNQHHFKSQLDKKGFEYVHTPDEIDGAGKYWMEIGNIDHTGHAEQSAIARRIPELFQLIRETLDNIFDKGMKSVKIVTDHGWLLLPGGLPQTRLPRDHVDSKWGRCALIKEGVQSSLPHFPWQWNPMVMVAYPEGISSFKANEEYTHGGVSLQECVTPVIQITSLASGVQKIGIEANWTNLKCKLIISGAKPDFQIDLRTKYSDEKSTIISNTKKIGEDGKVNLFVEDAAHESEAAFIVVLDEKGVILERKQTVVGES